MSPRMNPGEVGWPLNRIPVTKYLRGGKPGRLDEHRNPPGREGRIGCRCDGDLRPDSVDSHGASFVAMDPLFSPIPPSAPSGSRHSPTQDRSFFSSPSRTDYPGALPGRAGRLGQPLESIPSRGVTSIFPECAKDFRSGGVFPCKHHDSRPPLRPDHHPEPFSGCLRCRPAPPWV